jgi:hypothetical protein
LISDNHLLATESIKASYALAVEQKDKEVMLQILSMFVQNPNATRKNVSLLVGAIPEISREKYRNAQFHATTCGPGTPLEKICHPRLVEDKIRIVRELCLHCLKEGNNFITIC